MKKQYVMKKLVLLFLCTLASVSLRAQMVEPEFIGEVAYFKEDGTLEIVDKEYGNFRNAISLRSNSFNTLGIYIEGGTAITRFNAGNVKFIVKCVDNSSDPMSIIKVYKFISKKTKRIVELAVDNSDTMLSSKELSKNYVKFNSKKYGSSSYEIEFTVTAGEYGISVVNPNNEDEKQQIVYCFGVNK